MKAFRSTVFDGDKDWEVVSVSKEPGMGFHVRSKEGEGSSRRKTGRG